MNQFIYTVFSSRSGWVASECKDTEQALNTIKENLAHLQDQGYLIAFEGRLEGGFTNPPALTTIFKQAALVKSEIENEIIVFTVEQYVLIDEMKDKKSINDTLRGRTLGELFCPDYPLP